MAEKKYKRADCIHLLIEKRHELLEQGLDRNPYRSDFPVEQMVAIKANLGPWPHALKIAREAEERMALLEKERAEKRSRKKDESNGNNCGDR